MAATKRNAQFYVYELIQADGVVAYIGKGSGTRLSRQRRIFALDGHEVARFWVEGDAYAFERAAISEKKPVLNRHPGGNGSKAAPRRRDPRWVREIEAVGTMRYAARLLLALPRGYVEPSILDEIRRVAA